MLFMVNGRPKAGVTRDELILHLIVDGSSQGQEVFDLEIIPVNQFPHFD